MAFDTSVLALQTRGRVTAHEYVKETLRDGILNGTIPGGTRLVQAEIADQLKVSTTPVREALRDLAAEGLIELDAHRGGVVHQISREELDEVYDLRLLLEKEAMERAAERITDEQIEAVRGVLNEMQGATELSKWVILNRDFHLKIYEAAGSPRLLGMVRTLLNISVMYVSMALESASWVRSQATDDHEEFIHVLAERDAEAARELIQRHLEMSRSAVDENL